MRDSSTNNFLKNVLRLLLVALMTCMVACGEEPGENVDAETIEIDESSTEAGEESTGNEEQEEGEEEEQEPDTEENPNSSSSAGYCEGSAMGCQNYERNMSECIFHQCDWDAGSCTGVVQSCSHHDTEGRCEDQPNCNWSSMSESCLQGVFVACDYWFLETGCSDYTSYGCDWNAPSCTGIIPDCTEHTEQIDCDFFLGCNWVE